MLLDFVVKPKDGIFACFCYVVFYLASFSARRRNSVSRFYKKKSSTLTCVVWAEVSESGLGIKIGPRQQKLWTCPTVQLMGNPAVCLNVLNLYWCLVAARVALPPTNADRRIFFQKLTQAQG